MDMYDDRLDGKDMMARAILFVCLGNICRSPLAEGVLRHLLEERGLAGRFVLDSAGLGHWHEGEPPDLRARRVAAEHGIDITAQRARRIGPDDFTRFDLILAMDRSVLGSLQRLAPPDKRQRLHLFLDFALGRPEDVPDPYHGDSQCFLDVYRMIREASLALAEKLAERVASDAPSGQASSIT
jgi:protein-tyrosine phosphatase